MSDISDPNFSQKYLAAKSQSEEIRNSKSFNIFNDLQNFKISFFIYRRNFINWKRILREYYSEHSNSTSNSIKRHFRQKSIITTINNLLVSSTSFIEQYDIEQKNDPFHCLIKELRNYVTHNEYFPLISRLHADERGIEKFESFQLNKIKTYLANRIKEHPDWKTPKLAQEFINGLGESINFSEILHKYDLKIIDFYERYTLNYIEKNRKPFTELIIETEKVHSALDDIKVVDFFPISKAQLRYLKCLIKK